MATRFVDLNEAATMLGLTPDQLIEKRSNGDIHGYRDGASWKFKIEEVERFKAELTEGKADSVLRFDDGLDDLIMADDETGTSEDAESILVSDELGGPSPETSSSTIIGKSGVAPEADSDLKITGESELSLTPDFGSELSLDEVGSELSLDAGSSKKGSSVDSDVALIPGVGAGTDVQLVADAGSDRSLKSPSGLGADVLGDSNLALQGDSAVGPGSVVRSAGTGTGHGLGSSKLDSGDLDIALDSELALSDDDELVIGGSGVGSDLALNPADSGISLATPTDSGLSLEAESGISLQTPTDSGLNLEEPMEMGGSSISSLELPEDESIELDSGAFDAEPGQNLQKDEDFLLTPSDEMFTDESDSGSQVIALEDSVAFDQEAAGLDAQGALLAEAPGLDQQLDALGGGGVAAAPIGMPGPVYAGGPPEAPYSVWNITGLLMILLFLSLTGVLMTDMVRNMWAWEDGLDVASSISEGVTAAFGKE